MRWLCLDPGLRRTGVAISSPEGSFALPLLVLEHGPDGPPPEVVASLIRDHGVEGLVVGLPISMDGTASAQTRDAFRFALKVARYLQARVEIPRDIVLPELAEGEVTPEAVDVRCDVVVTLWDERLTSWEAQRATRTAGDDTRRRKAVKPRALDAHAAAVILQSFLDARSGRMETGAEDAPAAGTYGESD